MAASPTVFQQELDALTVDGLRQTLFALKTESLRLEQDIQTQESQHGADRIKCVEFVLQLNGSDGCK
jgi:hypothetical protein